MSEKSQLADLVDQLTLEEKASLCLGSDFWHTATVPRLGIESIMMSDGPHGLRTQPLDGDHVAISGSLPATCFPTASALGSAWDVGLAERIGAALGVEARANGVAVLLGPGINIKRSPLCGRNFEYFSEDPVLSGRLGAALVDGIQSRGVGASVKHFAANNQETDRLRVSAVVDERTLREIYLPAFEHVVTHARPWTVMCAYNKVNGVYASEHQWLLSLVLRQEWGFDGLVVSDWGAVHDRVAALTAGLDLEMPPHLGRSDAAIVTAVKTGELKESVLDTAVTRVLELVQRAGAGRAVDTGDLDFDVHHELARQAARESAVLLKNDPVDGEPLLPLNLRPGHSLAVIGEFARTPRYQGIGSSQVNPTRVDVPLDELRRAVPEEVRVEFAAGFRISENPLTDGELTPEELEPEALAQAAVALAASADTVLLFLGLAAGAESEGFDRTEIGLPADQIDLLARLARVNPRIVVVLANGSAVSVAEWRHQAPAILECWLSGQGGGRAVADLLLGIANPSGKLAETLPLRLPDNSSYLNFPGDSGQVRYGEGIFVGYRGYDAAQQQVAYPFGHGLSYTSFEYTDLTARIEGRPAGADLRISLGCRVTNTGPRTGAEIVQLYVRDEESTVARPVRELKAFSKVRLAPGESAEIRFTLGRRDLSYWSIRSHDWVLEAGRFEFAVGASSRDLRLHAVLDVEAPSLAGPLNAMSTLQEWLADPEGARVLRAAVGTDDDGRPQGLLGDEELIRVIGNFPLSTLGAFPGLGLDGPSVRALTEPE